MKNKQNRIAFALIHALLLAATLLTCQAIIAFSLPYRGRAIQDAGGKRIRFVCVVPLYKRVGGIAIGPDGRGGWSSEDAYLFGPFRFDSGSDFKAKIAPSGIQLIPIPPGIALGVGWAPVRMLVIKNGYEPISLREHEKYVLTPIIMKSNSHWEADSFLRLMAAASDNQPDLRNIFQVDSSVRRIQSIYSDEDFISLRKCLESQE